MGRRRNVDPRRTKYYIFSLSFRPWPLLLAPDREVRLEGVLGARGLCDLLNLLDRLGLVTSGLESGAGIVARWGAGGGRRARR